MVSPSISISNWRLAILLSFVLGSLVWFFTLSPIPQDLAHHSFADSRRVLGIPNLAKLGKPCPGWSAGKLQRKLQLPRVAGASCISRAGNEAAFEPHGNWTARTNSHIQVGDAADAENRSDCRFIVISRWVSSDDAPRPVLAVEVGQNTCRSVAGPPSTLDEVGFAPGEDSAWQSSSAPSAGSPPSCSPTS